MRSNDAVSLEALLVQALVASDGLRYEQVGAHVATALDALRREAQRDSARRMAVPVRRRISTR